MNKLLIILISVPGILMLNGQSLVAQTTDSIAMTRELKEIQITASFSSTKLKEPIVLNTLTGLAIENKLSNQEFPEILKSTPSAYATRQGGGYGDSRISLRGFGSENIGVLIDGIPINGMENGWVYWSNWAGLADVTALMQVQRGIGLSKLGVPSVGGTINIITQRSVNEKSASVYYGMGNDGYQKVSVGFNTGDINGWSFSMLGARTWGDGFVNGTNFEAWNYYVNLSKRIGTDHLLSFTAFGAPQWHNARSNRHSIEDYENHRDGIRMNTSYGYINGQLVSTYSGYNEYHKPQLSLNHYWTINDKSSLSTSVYASIAKGGGRKAYGKDANRIQYNYKTGKPNAITDLTPDGLIDYTPAMNANRLSEESSVIFTMGTNAHDWYGLVSNYSNNLTDELRLTGGLDFRYYQGYHYDEISDLLGGSYFKDKALAYRNPNALLKVGDRVGQDYLSRIIWGGAFAQLEYTKEMFKAFVSASLTSHSYKRQDPGKYGEYGDQTKYPIADVVTPWSSFLPVSIKGGINIKVAPHHRLFANAGYITKAPMMNNIYADNTPLSNPISEKIATVEAGYIFEMNNLNVTFNGYFTNWADKSVTKPIGAWNGPKACIPNIDARHMGFELEVNYRPIPSLRLGGFVSVGDWRWANDVEYTLIDQQNNEIGVFNAYLKDIHVGNAPQTSAALNVSWEVFKNFVVGADYNYYGDFYADFSPDERTNPDDRSDSWKLPDFHLVDMNVQYRMPIRSKMILTFYGNVNNLFDARYISDARDGSDHTAKTAVVWYGPGRTWTAGMRISF